MKLDSIVEARDPNLEYTEKEVKKVVDRVTTSLRSHQSGVMTKLAKRYDELETSLKELQSERNKLNADMKVVAEDLFDASDVVYTRVIETCSFVLTLSKQTQATTKLSVDHEAIVNELIKLIPEELQSKIDEIKEAFTKTEDVKAKSPSLSVKKANESVNEDLSAAFKKVKAAIAKMVSSLTSWAYNYDQKLEKLKAKAGM